MTPITPDSIPHTPMQKPVTATEMASMLRCGPRTVHAMATEGRIPFLSVGQRRLYEPERVFEALRQQVTPVSVAGRMMQKPSTHRRVEAMRK